MQLSSRARYAVMAMVELAARPCEAGHKVTLADIAARQQIPLCYLEQLFGHLRRAGLVLSARGPGGGYCLARQAGAISVADVLRAVDENFRVPGFGAPLSGSLDGTDHKPSACRTDDLWDALGRHIELFLEAVTLSRIVAGDLPRLSEVLGARTRSGAVAGVIYLDANASEVPRPEALDAMVRAASRGGNPASVHTAGRAARRVLEDAREAIAEAFGADAAGVVFTSGATEALALAVHALGEDRRLIVAATEHDAVRAAAHAGETVPVDGDGLLDFAALGVALGRAPAGPPALVCVMLANNETGVIQDIPRVVRLCREAGARLLVDAVQAAGRIAVDCAALGADAVALSSHKLGGPAGAGALLLAPGASRVAPLIAGGGQERGRRGGTPALPAIAGFAAAVEALRREGARARWRDPALRDAAESAAVSLGAVVVGADAPRLPNTVCLALPGVRADTQVMALDLAGICVSAGSACSSGKVARSHVLAAMGLGALAGEAIRVSLPWNARSADIEAFTAAYEAMASRLARRAA